jgi:hypothetical protein
MRNEQNCLDGRELYENIRWFYDKNHNHAMLNFDPLNGSIIGFTKNIAGKEIFISLKEALMNLDDPFTYDPKTDKFTEKTPQSLSYLIFAQFVWHDCSFVEIYDLEMSLYYTEKCEDANKVRWVTFQFPRKHIQNGMSFAVKVKIEKSPELLAYCVLMENNQIMTDVVKEVEMSRKWQETVTALTKDKQEQWKKLGKGLLKNRMLVPRICGMAREN